MAHCGRMTVSVEWRVRKLILVNGDGAVRGVQGDFGAAAVAVAAFEVGVAAFGGGLF